MNYSALGVFLGTAFFCWIMSYWLFHLQKEHREKEKDGELVVMESTQHKFLQLVLVGFILIGLVLNGYSVMDMSNRICEWNVVNATTVGNTTSFDHAYACEIVENAPSQRFLLLILYGTRIIGAYVIIYFITRIWRAWQDTKDSERRRQGR